MKNNLRHTHNRSTVEPCHPRPFYNIMSIMVSFVRSTVVRGKASSLGNAKLSAKLKLATSFNPSESFYQSHHSYLAVIWLLFTSPRASDAGIDVGHCPSADRGG